MQIIKAIDFGDIQRFRNGTAQRTGPPFVPRHMERVRLPRRIVGQPPGQRVSCFQFCRLFLHILLFKVLLAAHSFSFFKGAPRPESFARPPSVLNGAL